MNIVLAVTGSISAYKSYDLLRLLIKSENKVRVVLTSGALKFIQKETYIYLGAEKVYGPKDDFINENSDLYEGPVLHVNLAKWCDRLVVAPMSAHTLANFCSASACDLLTSLFLALPKNKEMIFFPAMNSEMLSHPFVRNNIETLNSLDNSFVCPTSCGHLACGDFGLGKLLPINEIHALSTTLTLKEKNKCYVITAGATIANIDSVRFVTNPSTGKTAIPLIEKLLSEGNKVVCLAGKYATSELDNYFHHPSFTIERVVSTQDMYERVMHYLPKLDVYISAAAISDLQFNENEGKLKKSNMSGALYYQIAVDILSEVIKKKLPHQKVIGFAAEVNLSEEVLEEKIQRKSVSFLVGTEVSSGLSKGQLQKGFGTEMASYRFVHPIENSSPQKFNFSKTQQLSKKQLAHIIYEKSL